MAEITGRKVFIVTAGAFAIIIGVNLYMAWQAVSTFPGLEVKSSYVASQSFDRNRAAQQALGWQLVEDYVPGEGLTLKFADAEGLPVLVENLQVLVGRTTSSAQDQTPEFRREAGVYIAGVTLDPGKWMLHVTAQAADGTPFQQRLDLMVEG